MTRRDNTTTRYDIYLVGVGGQGVLTIGELIAEAAFRKGIPVNFYPTKGMAQRGGFVKAQLRMGRATSGRPSRKRAPTWSSPPRCRRALRAVRYVKPGGDFVLFGHVWAPMAVMLGKTAYPSLDQVGAVQVRAAGGRPLHPGGEPPFFEGRPSLTTSSRWPSR